MPDKELKNLWLKSKWFYDPYTKDNNKNDTVSFKQEYEADYAPCPNSGSAPTYDVAKRLKGIDYAALEEKFAQLAKDTKKSTFTIKELSKVLKLEADPTKEEDVSEGDALFLQREEEELLVWYPRAANHELGYNEATFDSGPMRYFNLQDLLARFFIATHTYHGAVANWRNNCIGITNCYFHRDVGFMPVFDYDGKNVKTQIRKDTKLLQKEYGLGDAWVYETKRGFHVYFFCDEVDRSAYMEMLKVSGACEGFKRATESRYYAVLRVSAKYTEFDIKFLYVLPAKDGKLRRMPRKAHLIRALLDLGEKCGTHFASLYPQWAHYTEDKKEWKPAPNRRKGKRIRKAKAGSHAAYKQAVEAELRKAELRTELKTKKLTVEFKNSNSPTNHYVVTTSTTVANDLNNQSYWGTTTSSSDPSDLDGSNNF